MKLDNGRWREEAEELLRRPPLREELFELSRFTKTDPYWRAWEALVRHVREQCLPPLLAGLARETIAYFLTCDFEPGLPGKVVIELHKILAQHPALWTECFRLFEKEGPERVFPPDPPAGLVCHVYDVCPPPLQAALAEHAIEYAIDAVRDEEVQRDLALDDRERGWIYLT